jgi:hypothetical protein
MVVFVIKCTNTWLGKLRSNTPFPHDCWFLTWRIGVICPEIFDLDPDMSRIYFDFL